MNPYTNNFANISNYALRMGTRGDFATLSHPPSAAILCLNYCFSSSLTDLPLASASCTKLTKRGFFYFFFLVCGCGQCLSKHPCHFLLSPWLVLGVMVDLPLFCLHFRCLFFC